jgi:hypothetical protein
LGIDTAGSGLTPYDLFQFVLPQVSTPFAALYVGVLPLGLALFALAQLRGGKDSPSQGRQTRALTYFLGGLALVSLLLSFGTLTPLYHLAYLLAPGWRLFRQQERVVVWVVFGLALLAGLAASALYGVARSASEATPGTARPTGDEHLLTRGYWIAAAVAAIFAIACLVGFLAGADNLWGFAASGLLLALLLVLAGLALSSRRPAWIIALMVLDLFALTGRQHAGDQASAIVFPPGPLISAVASDKSDLRTADEDVLPGNFGYGYGLEDINGSSPLRLTAYDRLLQGASKPLLWRLLGVKYVVGVAQGITRARYYPGVKPITVKLLAEPVKRRLIGAQMVGGEGIKERADFLAMALRTGITIDEFATMENVYSPAIGALNEPIALAAQALLAKL